MTFGVAGGLQAGKTFYDALKLFKRLVNMGDAKSLACHPATLPPPRTGKCRRRNKKGPG